MLPLKIHVCGEREVSNLELAQMIAGFLGKTLHYELVSFHESRPGHDLAYRMRDDLIRDFGWKRPMGLEASLEKTVKWYLANTKWLGL
jgi:dTDP-glucose 4,6-dehydratase